MMRAVLDANVVISAMLAPDGVPAQLVEAVDVGFSLVWSPAIVEECLRVSRYSRLVARFRVADPIAFVASLAEAAVMVAGDLPQVDAVRADPSDDVYLATALAGAAPFLVTGDRRHLLSMKIFAGVRIVTPKAFLGELGRR